MGIAREYIQGLQNAYQQAGFSDAWEHLESVAHGARQEDIERLKLTYPECPDTLIKLLQFVDGTYHRQYKNEHICFYFLGSDVYEYPYYLLSAAEMVENENIVASYYSDYIGRVYEEVAMDDRITNKIDDLKWLHFSDCMNNGGTSQLFIDFTPSEKGVKGQVVRFLHDPDEFSVIANSFDEYLRNIIADNFEFIHEDILL